MREYQVGGYVIMAEETPPKLSQEPYYYFNGSLALNAAERWLNANKESDAIFEVSQDWLSRSTPGQWTVHVVSYNTGEILGYVAD